MRHFQGEEVEFFKSDLTDPLRFLMHIFWKIPMKFFAQRARERINRSGASGLNDNNFVNKVSHENIIPTKSSAENLRFLFVLTDVLDVKVDFTPKSS